MLGGERLGGGEELVHNGAMFRFEATLLSWGESFVRQAKVRDGFQCFSDAPKLFLDAPAHRTQGRG